MSDRLPAALERLKLRPNLATGRMENALGAGRPMTEEERTQYGQSAPRSAPAERVGIRGVKSILEVDTKKIDDTKQEDAMERGKIHRRRPEEVERDYQEIKRLKEEEGLTGSQIREKGFSQTIVAKAFSRMKAERNGKPPSNKPPRKPRAAEKTAVVTAVPEPALVEAIAPVVEPKQDGKGRISFFAMSVEADEATIRETLARVGQAVAEVFGA